MTQIFLLANASQGLLWPDPGNWNPSNKVECLGSGGAGESGTSGTRSGNGGGGGAYAVGNNVNPTFPVKYNCMLGGTPGSTSSPRFFTAFGMGASTDGSDGLVRAKQGDGGIQGGTAGNAFSPAGFSGGTGGAGVSGTANSGGGGGGGAGGPMGAGGAGEPGLAGLVNGRGGTADGGTVGLGTGAGQSNQRWDATHGCGGGGSGAADSSGGFAGGLYGGGGGGGNNVSSPSSFRNGGAGRDGLIIINYIPLVPSKGLSFNMPMGGL
jgi:hypothetical protein